MLLKPANVVCISSVNFVVSARLLEEWIATEDGLNRFDGHRFKVYKSGKATNNSLKNNYIETLFLDSKGLLWIGFKTGGVDIYNPRTDQFIHLNEQVSEPIPNRIVSIFEDSDHNIWLGSWEEGICKLTPKNTNVCASSDV